MSVSIEFPIARELCPAYNTAPQGEGEGFGRGFHVAWKPGYGRGDFQVRKGVWKENPYPNPGFQAT